MSMCRFFAILIAVAMMFVPLAMPGGPAMAAPGPSRHDLLRNQMDHCGAKAGHPQNRGKSIDRSCCAAMCIGVALAPVSTEPALAYARMAPRPSADPFRRGCLGEIATPPPRPA
jgi:hypothetical protein